MVSEAANPNPSPVSTAATSSELELIEQLKRQLAGPVFAAVSNQFSHLQNTVISYQKQAAVCGTEDRCTGGAVATGADREVRAGQRKVSPMHNWSAGTGAGSQRCGSPGGERASGGAALDENEVQASGAAATAGGPSAC